MKFLQRYGNKITEPLQLYLPQSEIGNSSYKINKATVSAVFTDSGRFIVSCITPRIHILKFWIFDSKSSMNFVSWPNWIYFNRSFVARDKIRIALLCRIAEITDLVYRIKIDRGLQGKEIDWDGNLTQLSTLLLKPMSLWLSLHNTLHSIKDPNQTLS